VVQWFERGRFELHPENAPPYDVLLGLLGSEVRNNGGAPAQPGQPTPTPTPAPAPPAPEQINFEEPGRLTCDDLAIDEIFQPGQTYTTNIGEFDIPVEVPICLRAWTPNVQVQIEVRKPDGSRDREEVTPDANGFADWYYQRLTGNRQGDYEVTVRQGETRVDGEFELERTPESEPKVLVRERVVEPGDEVEVHVGGLAPNSRVTLHYYRRCESDDGCYVASLAEATANSDGQAEVELRTATDIPEDLYAIGFFRDPNNADSFVYDTFEIAD
jgi:5-hydroxyisourate hydrolase-like protein (transthyretin family)